VNMNDIELSAIAEKLGEAGHIAWAEKRRTEKGWHAPEECSGKIECYTCSGTGKITTPLIGGGSETHDCLLCDGTGKTPCPRCHTCMRPYKDLPDSEKELPRAYPALFLKVLNEMGYEIVKR